MNPEALLTLDEIEPQVCLVAEDVLSLKPGTVSIENRLIEDLYCDSLDLLNFVLALEERFEISIPDDPPEPAKAIFTRREIRLADIAELVYVRQGTGHETGRRSRRNGSIPISSQSPPPRDPFLQLSGIWRNGRRGKNWLFEPYETNPHKTVHYRRGSDGMACVKIPAAEVEIGALHASGPPDEQPGHVVGMDEFLIDAEPVSTTAYCRFLNSIDEPSPKTLADWFVLDPGDDRNAHMPIHHSSGRWEPVNGTAYWPMMLVSWYGANAYSLWANGWDWQLYRKANDPEAPCFLPSEAQWEYAARGPRRQSYPWGENNPTSDHARCGIHESSRTYDIHEMPLANVHERLGESPFGLRHMAGNVWNWCRDWYDPDFYATQASQAANPLNHTATGIRSERGGSWVGPSQLCRSSYRRGRQPLARGRCLGFRCVSSLKDAPPVE